MQPLQQLPSASATPSEYQNIPAQHAMHATSTSVNSNDCSVGTLFFISIKQRTMHVTVTVLLLNY
jgi:hypothetical protein